MHAAAAPLVPLHRRSWFTLLAAASLLLALAVATLIVRSAAAMDILSWSASSLTPPVAGAQTGDFSAMWRREEVTWSISAHRGQLSLSRGIYEAFRETREEFAEWPEDRPLHLDAGVQPAPRPAEPWWRWDGPLEWDLLGFSSRGALRSGVSVRTIGIPLAAPLLLLLAAPAAWAWSWSRSRRREREGRCLRCGHAIHAGGAEHGDAVRTPRPGEPGFSGSACPECGTPSSARPPAWRGRLPSSAGPASGSVE